MGVGSILDGVKHPDSSTSGRAQVASHNFPMNHETIYDQEKEFEMAEKFLISYIC